MVGVNRHMRCMNNSIRSSIVEAKVDNGDDYVTVRVSARQLIEVPIEDTPVMSYQTRVVTRGT